MIFKVVERNLETKQFKHEKYSKLTKTMETAKEMSMSTKTAQLLKTAITY